MLTVLNWGEKSKKVCDASISNCSNCNHLATFEIRSCEKTAGIFFISMAKWDKKYYFVCQKCSAGFPILEDKIDESLKLFTEAPSHDLSMEIYKELKYLFILGKYLSSEEKLLTYSDDAVNILKEKGYRENDIRYIIPIAFKEFLKMIEEIKQEKTK